jgi:DNA-binding Xre family transcriptional regulator
MLFVNIYNVKWKRKYTRKEIAKTVGLSPTTITKLTKGEHIDVKISTIEKLAKFFECNAKDIIVEVPDTEVNLYQ